MTDDRTLERAARSWLEEGPMRAPDRPVEAALARIQTTRQERDLRIPWRLPIMSTNRVAVVAVAIALVAVGGFALSRLPGGGPGGPDLTPSPSPSLTPGPSSTLSPSPSASPKDAFTITTADVDQFLYGGTYHIDGFAVPFSMTPPSGYQVVAFTPGNFVARKGESEFTTLVKVAAVYPDPCHTEGGPTPVGPSVDDLVAAFSSMAGFELTDMKDAVVGGATGKAFTLTNSINPSADGCSSPDVVWIGRDASGDDILEGAPAADPVWVLDVAGTTILMGAPQEVVDTISFEAGSSN
jgi:hypothetical protein